MLRQAGFKFKVAAGIQMRSCSHVAMAGFKFKIASGIEIRSCSHVAVAELKFGAGVSAGIRIWSCSRVAVVGFKFPIASGIQIRSCSRVAMSGDSNSELQPCGHGRMRIRSRSRVSHARLADLGCLPREVLCGLGCIQRGFWRFLTRKSGIRRQFSAALIKKALRRGDAFISFLRGADGTAENRTSTRLNRSRILCLREFQTHENAQTITRFNTRSTRESRQVTEETKYLQEASLKMPDPSSDPIRNGKSESESAMGVALRLSNSQSVKCCRAGLLNVAPSKAPVTT